MLSILAFTPSDEIINIGNIWKIRKLLMTPPKKCSSTLKALYSEILKILARYWRIKHFFDTLCLKFFNFSIWAKFWIFAHNQYQRLPKFAIYCHNISQLDGLQNCYEILQHVPKKCFLRQKPSNFYHHGDISHSWLKLVISNEKVALLLKLGSFWCKLERKMLHWTEYWIGHRSLSNRCFWSKKLSPRL